MHLPCPSRHEAIRGGSCSRESSQEGGSKNLLRNHHHGRTALHPTRFAQISGNTSNTSNAIVGSLVLAGGNNITLSQVSAAGGATVTISAGATAAPIATAVKGVSSIGSTGTITRFAPEDHQHAGLHQISVGGNTAGNTTAGAGSLVLAGGPNITLSGATAAGGMTLSISGGAGAGGGFSAGISTGGNTLGTSGTVGSQLVLVGGSNITLSQSVNGVSATVSIIGPSAGGGAAEQRFVEFNGPVGGLVTIPPLRAASLSVRPLIQPFLVVGGGVSAKTMQFMASRSGGTSLVVTVDMGIYTMVNATSLALLSNTTNGFSLTASTEFSGNRMYEITGLSNLTLSAGRYWMGLLVSATGTAVADLALLGAGTVPTLVGSVFAGADQTSATNVSNLMIPFAGVYSATSGALPANIGASDMWGGSGSSQHAPYYAAILDV